MITADKFKCRWCDETFEPGEGELLARHVMSEHSTQFVMSDHFLEDEPTEPTEMMMVRRPPIPLGEMEPLYTTKGADWSWLPLFLIILLVILAITIITSTL